MTYTFVTWKPDLGETEEDDGQNIEAKYPDFAAEEAAKRDYWSEPSGYNDDEVIVMVRLPGEYVRDRDALLPPYMRPQTGTPQLSEVKKYRVVIEQCPVFIAFKEG